MSNALDAKLADVFNEPGCEKNQGKSEKERKKGCSKALTPGAAAGGCAFDGAKIVLQPITDAVHLVHGPLACEGNGWDNRPAASSGPTIYRSGFTTDVSEVDIVMGNGDKRLYRALKEVVAKYAPPAIFVYSTCVTALIGDDIEAVCKHASAKLKTPVIPVNAPGFVGSKNLGNKLAGEALLDHVIGSEEPEQSTPLDINILGDYNLSGELWQVLPLFERLGIRVHACITGDARYRKVASAHRSRVNMMVCSTALINLARKMQERYDIPYFEGSFYGIEDTSISLRTTAKLLVERGAPADLLERTEELIRSEEARAWQRIRAFTPRLAGKRVLLYTGGVKSWSIVSALMEMGMVVVNTSTRKSTPEDKQRIIEIMKEDAHMVDSIAPRDMYASFARGEADILLSGGRTQFVALKAKLPWVDINQERHHAYAGYDGMVELVRQIDLELNNPIWADVRRPAPWQTGEQPSAAARAPASQVVPVKKACAVNPLKSSTPLGAALAFLGVEGAVPLFHGSQGCTSFAMVLAVRHFKEAIPLQTTAMDEAATVLGGADNLEEALINLQNRMKPRLIGVASTALVETRGEDFRGELNHILRKRPELAETAVVFASTPDFEGALEDGWSKATAALIEALVAAPSTPSPQSSSLNVLVGVHQTPSDIDELRAIVESFGLEPTFLPDISTSLDGNVPDAYVGTSLGGATLAAVRGMGSARHTIAIGEHMRAPAEALSRRSGVPHTLLPNVTGLRASDALIGVLSELTGRTASTALQRQRSQLVDSMLDAHFHFSGKRVAIGSDPDLLYALAQLFHGLGAEIVCAVASTKNSLLLSELPCAETRIGDLTDLEEQAAARGAELLVTHSHGRMAAERLDIPLFRVGFPIFDRLGAQHRCSVGYRGSRQLISEIANVFLAQLHAKRPEDFAGVLPPAPVIEDTRHVDA